MIFKHFNERIKSFCDILFLFNSHLYMHLPKAYFTDIFKIKKECETRLLSAKFHMFHEGKLEQGYTGLLIKTSVC